MLTEIHLTNFKCFGKETGIPLKQMNLLTGINGRGKSTLLQALLCMHQSPEQSRVADLHFNGSYISLGVFDDVKNRVISRSESIVLGFDFDEGDNFATLTYSFRANPEDDQVAKFERLIIAAEIDGKEYDLTILEEDHMALIEGLDQRVPFLDMFIDAKPLKHACLGFVASQLHFHRIHYVSADRIGPQHYYQRKSSQRFHNVGSRGEYTVDMLQKLRDTAVAKVLQHEASATPILMDQVSAWFSEVFTGGKLDVKKADEANLLTLTMNPDSKSAMHKPVNIGYGYSHVLPIIITGLIAEPGDILVIENPEAHLHPAAQSRIGAFLAKVSKNNVQVFVETHSDHILNSIRLSVKRGVLSPDETNVLYFEFDEKAPYRSIPIDEKGRIETWPEGFFDQSRHDLGELHDL